MSRLNSPWINVVAGIVGGLVLGIGIGLLASTRSFGAAIWTVLGMILLWWAFTDRRKAQRSTPESEVDGSHTIE
ncbi:hypothetical protein BH23GEM3_BH23GEM3_10790 [soil metagenome]|jgi:F0F1-type ATP synthase assembly protein I